MPIREHVIDNFPNGVIDTVESKDIPEGASSKSLNWLTQGDRIELRRGQQPIGTESTSAGKITGIWTAFMANGTAVIFRKNARKLEYFIKGTSSDWAECGTNMFPSAASADTASFSNYTTSAGNQMFVSSPNSGLYKVMVANPDSFTNLSSSGKNFSGQFRMKISQNRMLAWGRPTDKTGVYGSYIDTQSYQTILGDNLGAAPGATHTLTGTLQFKNNNPIQTCFGIVLAAATSPLTSITAITQATSPQVSSTSHGLTIGDYVVFQGITGMSQLNYRIAKVVTTPDANHFTIDIDTTGFSAYSSSGSVGKAERFTDDYNGKLSSPAGGTGTVNYTTGAVSATFNGTPPNTAAFVAEEQTEDSTNNGIADFTHSSPRTAGQGFVFRQDEDGADMQNSFSYTGHEFCFHKLRTWDLNITDTDTDASNLPYRARVGLSNWQNGLATASGVYYINDIDLNNVKLEKIALNEFSTDVVPTTLSKRVTQEGVLLGAILDGYLFDQGFLFEFGDLILCACRTSDSATNNRVITYNKLTGAIDYHSFTASCFTIVGSELWAGDSVSPNVYKLFYGFAEGNALINNSWEGKLTSLAEPGEAALLYIKKVRRLVLQGLIAVSQSYDVYAAPDGGDYVYVGTISGSGDYVDKGQAVSVTIGYGSIGSTDIGGSSNTVNAYNYEHALRLPFNSFVQARLKFVATGIGYISISRVRWHDVILKRLSILKQYA